MQRQQLSYQSTDAWEWNRATALDVDDIVKMAEQIYSSEISDILTPNPTRMKYHVQKGILNQTYHPEQELISVARDKVSKHLLAWAWVVRGHYTPYANEEMAVAEFSHVDLSLSLRQRMRLVGQTFEQWILWAELYQIPVLCSTSIRSDQSGFMRLHDAYGFSRHGSFAYRRIT